MLYRRLVTQPYEAIISWLRQRTEQAGVDDVDHQALALVMVAPMSAYRGTRSIFGRVPGEVDDERLVETCVDVALAYARERGIAPTPWRGRAPRLARAPGPAERIPALNTSRRLSPLR